MNLSDLAHAYAGQRIPGGCADCDAYQTLHPDPEHPNVAHLRIHHDDTCPFLRQMQG